MILHKLRDSTKNCTGGNAILLPPYLNLPKVYWKYYDDLKNIFKLRVGILERSQKKINAVIKKKATENSSPSVIIGIHVRSNRQYINHLKLYGTKPMGIRYYKKAINHFKNIYYNPLFLVVGDSKNASLKNVVQPLYKGKTNTPQSSQV